ncbi:MAG: F0F1 ATP synthase subunit gamma [Proteobacteria bacterium]|nr:F0F1 ATP synthase subunit gamma [Pseudomonadota bacterium]
MPANLKDLRTRIKSVKNTQQITKAMKLVSAAKFGRAQNNVLQARPYARSLEKLVVKLVAGARGADSALNLLKSGSSGRVLLIVISSERGLCGGYNTNTVKAALRAVDELVSAGKKPVVMCIGKKAFQVLSKRTLPGGVKGQKQVPMQKFVEAPASVMSENENGIFQLGMTFDKPNYEFAQTLATAVETAFGSGEVGEVHIVYNQFQSAMTQVPVSEKVLPLQSGGSEDGVTGESILEPSWSALAETILPRYLATRIYQVLLEAIASEHGARMTAMDNATRNAKDMERRLQITYQRARQAAITRELIEIISGAEAL